MRQPQAIALAALVVAAALLLAFVSHAPSHSSTTAPLAAMSDESQPQQQHAAHHHHHTVHQHHLVGGKGTEQAVTDEVKQLVLDNRAAIESAAGGEAFEEFEPVAQRSQVVSGMNYFVKIRTGSDKYVHATIYRKLDQSVHVTKVETGKSKDDQL